MATKAQVESLMRENAELKKHAIDLERRNIEVIDKLKASYNSEIAYLKDNLRPASIGDVKRMIDEAISKLNLNGELAPWDSD